MTERIGVNADSFAIDGDPAVLELQLARFHEAGFSHVEIPVHGLDCILNGSLCERRVADARRILSAHRFGYTVHSPDLLNLADPEDPETHARALLSTLDFAAEIGASLVVYHGSVLRGTAADARVSWAEEIERLGLAAEEAGRRGLRLAVENVFRQSARERSYRIDPRELAAVVGAVASPALGICFDFGHAFISSREEGFDLLEAFAAVLPRLVHVHLHDNFGKPSVPGSRPLDLLFRGAGDLHLPPGWASIPYEKLFPLFARAFDGVYMLEIQPRFADSYSEALNWVRRRIALVRDGPG